MGEKGLGERTNNIENAYLYSRGSIIHVCLAVLVCHPSGITKRALKENTENVCNISYIYEKIMLMSMK